MKSMGYKFFTCNLFYWWDTFGLLFENEIEIWIEICSHQLINTNYRITPKSGLHQISLLFQSKTKILDINKISGIIAVIF